MTPDARLYRCPECRFYSTREQVYQIRPGPRCPRCGGPEVRNFEPVPEENEESSHDQNDPQ